MSYRGWLLAAGLLASGGPLGADKEFPIGAWFPGMIEGETTTRDGAPTATDRLVWERRLASTPSMPGAGVGSLRTPHYNQPWMDLAHAKGLKVQLHSWRQPEEWTESSRNYWTRTFSPIRSAGRSPTATGLCGMPKRIGSPVRPSGGHHLRHTISCSRGAPWSVPAMREPGERPQWSGDREE